MNLRFYVRHQDEDGIHRGVVFLREVVPRRAIAAVARLVYNEPYVALPMRHAISPDDRTVSYQWKTGGLWNGIDMTAATHRGALPEPASEEEFITEHYRGYTKQRDGSTVVYVVEHPRWSVRTALDARLRADVAGLWGEEFASLLARPPTSTFLAGGSEVLARRGRRLR